MSRKEGSILTRRIMAIAARGDDEGRLILPDSIRSMLSKETSFQVEIMEDGSLRLTLSPGHLSNLSLLVDAAKELTSEDMALEDVLALVEEASEQVYLARPDDALWR